jgi:hypothetical protein
MTKFYISANKTLVSNGQIKIRVDSNAQSTTTTTTAAPGVSGFSASGNEWTSANGTFCPAGTYDGVTYYTGGAGYYLWREGTYWFIHQTDAPGNIYYSPWFVEMESPSSTPPLTGWNNGGTLSQTTCGTTTTTTTTTAAPTTTTTTAPALLSRSSTSGTWTGAGTSESPYSTTSDIVPTSTRVPSGFLFGNDFYLFPFSFTLNATGKIRFSCEGRSDTSNDSSVLFAVFKNGVFMGNRANTIFGIYADTDWHLIDISIANQRLSYVQFGGQAGDVFTIYGSTYEGAHMRNISVYALPLTTTTTTVAPATTTTSSPNATTTTTTAGPMSLSYAAGYRSDGISMVMQGIDRVQSDGWNAYYLSGSGTVSSPMTLVLGASETRNNKVWLQVMGSGTLNWTFTVSSEVNYDYGSLHKSSGPPSSSLPAGSTTIVDSSSGSYTSSGTLTVTQGEFLVLTYFKDSSDDVGNDTVTLTAYIS